MLTLTLTLTLHVPSARLRVRIALTAYLPYESTDAACTSAIAATPTLSDCVQVPLYAVSEYKPAQCRCAISFTCKSVSCVGFRQQGLAHRPRSAVGGAWHRARAAGGRSLQLHQAVEHQLQAILHLGRGRYAARACAAPLVYVLEHAGMA